MKISKILFLTINILVISCGKNNPKGSHTNLSDMDDDGDFITNFYDESPYIALDPINDLKMAVTDQNKKYDFKRSIKLKEHLYKYIALNLNKKNLNFNVDYELLTSKLPAEVFRNNKVAFEVQSEQNVENLHLELYRDQKLLNPIQSAELGVSFLELNKLAKGSSYLTLKIKDFEFEREYQTYQYSELQKSLRAKTFRLSILPLSGHGQMYHVSKKINLAQALSKIGYPEHFVTDLMNRNYPLLQEEMATLHADSHAWVLIKNLDSYILVEVNKSLINDYRTKIFPLKMQTNQIDYQIHFDFKRIFKLNFVPKGELTLYNYSHQVHRGKTRIYRSGHRDAMREERKKCKYTVHTLQAQKIAIGAHNFTTYYDVFVNGKKVKVQLNEGRVNYQGTQNINELTFKVKQNYRQSYLQGISDGPRDRCGKDAIKSNGRSLRYSTRKVFRIKSHQIHLEMNQFLRPR
ncbi:MAG: hypothetical protein CME62_08540 [Halobacteriovoraceae bacterium]|nr:hypothetical protein [Halobacteriovoraceae bacterium]|tara:strand:- start:1793 stop:3178 length:1386 start_codon:yes stop_codon:yes gene_type:complete